jgi:tetratricopeptide (TPR) repeat protein
MTHDGHVSRAVETVGQRLRRLRIERGLSQRAIADQGVSYAYISRIEAGTRTPSVKALRVLAKKLEVSVDYLETGSELGAAEERELRLRDAELELRLSENSTAAEHELEQLLTEATAAGDAAVATRARAALGNTAHRRGEHEAAIKYLEPAVLGGSLSVLEAGDVYRTLGRAYSAVGRPGDAVQLFEDALHELEEVAPDDDAAYVRFMTYLSYALSDAGDLPRAREIVATALRRTQGVTDTYTRVRLYWSYARIALTEQRPRVALEHLRRAVTLLETTEDTRELARSHLFWAEISTFDGRADEAGQHLSIAEGLLGTQPDHDDLCLLRTEQARAAAEAGRGEEAVRLAEEALELIGEGDDNERATALWALGRGRASTGDTEGGIDALRQALAIFEAQHAWPEAAGAARTLGHVLRKEGREAEALDALEQAVDLATRAESRPSGASRN